MEIVDSKIRGRYLAVRHIAAQLIYVFTSIFLGWILDLFQRGFFGFLIIYIFSILFGLFNRHHLKRITDVSFQIDKNKLKIRDLFLLPIKNKMFF